MDKNKLVENYLDAKKKLEAYKRQTFPKGTKVIVDHPRYHGPGISNPEGECPPEKLAVKLPNNNTWWYEINTCTPAPAETP